MSLMMHEGEASAVGTTDKMVMGYYLISSGSASCAHSKKTQGACLG